MKNLTIEKFMELTASKNAVPGGGSVAALCGGLSAALVEMVANLTIGNKKYPDAEENLKEVREKATILHKKLLDYIEKDSEAYMLVMNAYKMPKYTEDEKMARADVIQTALKQAAVIPMEIASMACRVIELSKEVVEHGNKNAVTDGMVSAMLARTATLAALLNVRINLGSIKDTVFVADMEKQADELQKSCIGEEDSILNSVTL